MVYEIKTATEYFGGADGDVQNDVEKLVGKLVEEWLASAEELAGAANDKRSRRFGLVQQACTQVFNVRRWDGAALTGLVEEVLTAARETIAEDKKAEDKKLAERIKPVVQVIEGVMEQGIPSQPGNDDGEELTAWEVLTGKLEEQFRKLFELLREQGSVLAMMHSCKQVLGLLRSRTGSHPDMLLLLKDGELVALAIAADGAIHDLLTKPQRLADGIRGAGSALMEYIVRRAKAKHHKVSLIPLDSAALRVYTAWGFTGNMHTMVLQPDAADRLLERYKNFAGHVFQ